MNRKLSELLSQAAAIYGAKGEDYRSAAYENAAKLISHIDGPLSSQRVAAFHGIGEAMKAHLIEYINTGKIKELDKLLASKEGRAYMELTSITGVGPATAKKWIGAGIFTVAQLRTAVKTGKQTLNNAQALGLKYRADLARKIPRIEYGFLGAAIKYIIHKIDPNARVMFTGSYRRDKPESGDVDILVTTIPFNANLLPLLMNSISADPKYLGAFSNGLERVSFLYRSKYARQIDILHVKPESFFPALLYFTGSWEFNEQMRSRLKILGYRLNQTGLYKITKQGLVLIPVTSEGEIFAVAQMPYLEPHMRG